MQDCSISSALAMEILQSSTKSSMYAFGVHKSALAGRCDNNFESVIFKLILQK